MRSACKNPIAFSLVQAKSALLTPTAWPSLDKVISDATLTSRSDELAVTSIES